MSNIGTSSSGDESSSPIASPQPTGSKSNFSSRSHAIEPQAPSRGRPATRLATRPPKRPGSISPSPAGTQANSPASSYRSTRPALPPIEKWAVASLRQALSNSDIQAPRKSTKADLYELYKNLKPPTLSPKSTTKASRKRKHAASPRWTPPSSSRSKTSSQRASNSGIRPSASQSRAPDFADARPDRDSAAAHPYTTDFSSAIPKPSTQTSFWPPPPVSAPQPNPPLSEPAAQAYAWPQWPTYTAPQPAPSGPGPSAQANAWPQWPPNIIPQPTPLSLGSVAQGNAGPLELQNPAPPPAAYNTLLQAKPQYSLFTATPMPVPSNAIATEPPQVAHNIRAQILAGADIDLSSLLSLLPTSDSNRQIDCGDFSVTLKKPNPLSSRILSFPELSIAFSRFTEIICSAFPHRRRELNDYLAIIAELALSYGGGHFFTYHKLFSAKCAVRVAQWNQCPYWGALDLDLHSRVFLGCRNIACAVCRSVAHSTSNCPRINPSATPGPEPTSVKSTSYVPRPATVPYSDHETTAPYAADKRQPCFSFNNRRCGRPRCRYLHICSFCGGAHARVVCPVFKVANKKFKNYLSTPVNIPRLATELTHHPDREFREYLLLGLSQGFNPGVECALSQNHTCNNLQSAHAEPDTVNDLIAGFMIGPFDEPHFKVFRISPIGIATRKFSGKKRLIIDLSSPIIPQSPVLTA